MDLQHDREESRLLSVGTHAHGLVLWKDRLITLDSEGSALVAVHPSNGSRRVIWRVSLKGHLNGLAQSNYKEVIDAGWAILNIWPLCRSAADTTCAGLNFGI